MHPHSLALAPVRAATGVFLHVLTLIADRSSSRQSGRVKIHLVSLASRTKHEAQTGHSAAPLLCSAIIVNLPKMSSPSAA